MFETNMTLHVRMRTTLQTIGLPSNKSWAWHWTDQLLFKSIITSIHFINEQQSFSQVLKLAAACVRLTTTYAGIKGKRVFS